MIKDLQKQCSGCRTCEMLCPVKAIKMVEDKKGFKYPYVDEEKCIHCGICAKRCPLNENDEKETKKVAFAAYSKNEQVRLESSSGGIFTELAEYVLEQNGVIFGAAFDEGFGVKHIGIHSKDDLKKLRTSKYVQSDVNTTYEEAKKFLDNNVLVYFSGTPCQIEGLKKYLNKEYDNLITQDIICHGAPSPRVWKEYINRNQSKIQNINFRDKEKNGWEDFELKIEYKDGVQATHHDEDKFMKLFLNNYILRESCYNCKFKKINRVSDFVLADFWGVNKVVENMNDKKGTSLVILNTEKAIKIWEKLSDKIVQKEVEITEAIRYNVSMIKSVEKPEDIERVNAYIDNGEFDKIFAEA